MSDMYPSEPSPRGQPRVHSGGLLRDHPQLRDALLRKQDEYMVNLVNASRTPGPPTPHGPSAGTADPPPLVVVSDSVPGSASSDVAGSATSSPLAVTTPPDQESQPVPGSPVLGSLPDVPKYRAGDGGLPSQRKPDQPAPTGGEARGAPQWGPFQGHAEAAPANALYAPMQMLWWQHMYAWHYYIQQQVAMAASQPPAAAFASHPSPPSPPFLDEADGRPCPAPEPAPQNPPDAQADAEQQQQQQRQHQQQQQGAAEDEAASPDWLDRLYTVSNVCVLLSIMYFSSSASLFLIVAGAVLLVYLHQNAWFPFRAEQQHPAGGGEEAETRRDAQEAGRPADRGEGGGGGGSEENGDVRRPPGAVATAWTFVSTFFISLVPEAQPQI